MKIITHNGLFHADEVFAIALIHEVIGECKVERTRNVSTEELDNQDIWVLDQYGELDEAKHNFDHHQDPEIESTNVLILDYLHRQGHISAVQHDKLEPMFKAISSIDRKGYDQPDKKGFQVNYLIKTLNNIENNFDMAVLIARTYIRCELESIKKAKESRFIQRRTINGV